MMVHGIEIFLNISQQPKIILGYFSPVKVALPSQHRLYPYGRVMYMNKHTSPDSSFREALLGHALALHHS